MYAPIPCTHLFKGVRDTNMKRIALLLITLTLTSSVMASDDYTEESVKHMVVADVTSLEQAKKIFIETTADIESKTKLDATELHEIHIITYSLEKSVAYFAEHLKADKQALAKEIAIVVEDIHISSENNRKDQAQANLQKYFKLAEQFISGV